MVLDQGSDSVFCKGSDSKMFGYVGHLASVLRSAAVAPKPPQTICEQRDVARFQCNLIYKNRPRARFGTGAIVCQSRIYKRFFLSWRRINPSLVFHRTLKNPQDSEK